MEQEYRESEENKDPHIKPNWINSDRSKSKPLKVWYTNCDVLTSLKIQELSVNIDHFHPDIICITEVKPKNYQRTLTLVEYNIPGYNIEHKNILDDIGRGMILYIKNSFTYELFDNELVTGMNPQEILLTEVKFYTVNIFFAFIYRSPNSDLGNTDYLNESLKTLSDIYPSNFIVIGDFNYPKIDWEHYTTTASINDILSKFLDCVRDCFFEQLVDKPTRGRNSDNPSLIDLVLTNNNEIIDSTTVLPPLGKSDHGIVEVLLQDFSFDESYDTYWDYARGDYDSMNKMFDIECCNLFLSYFIRSIFLWQQNTHENKSHH